MGGFPYCSPPFGVTSAEVVINCPDTVDGASVSASLVGDSILSGGVDLAGCNLGWICKIDKAVKVVQRV